MRTTLLNIFDFLNDYFSSVDWQETILPVKVASVIICLILFVVWLYLLWRIIMIFKKPAVAKLGPAISIIGRTVRREVSQDWQTILDRLEKEDEAGYRLAVIEADKLLDNALKEAGLAGEDMAARLKQVQPNQLSNLDEVWQAHKLRNRLVHEPGFPLNRSRARRMVEIYQRAIEDLSGI